MRKEGTEWWKNSGKKTTIITAGTSVVIAPVKSLGRSQRQVRVVQRSSGADLNGGIRRGNPMVIVGVVRLYVPGDAL